MRGSKSTKGTNDRLPSFVKGDSTAELQPNSLKPSSEKLNVENYELVVRSDEGKQISSN